MTKLTDLEAKMELMMAQNAALMASLQTVTAPSVGVAAPSNVVALPVDPLSVLPEITTVKLTALDDGSQALVIPKEPISVTAKGFNVYGTSGKKTIILHNGQYCWLNYMVTSLGPNGLKIAEGKVTPTA